MSNWEIFSFRCLCTCAFLMKHSQILFRRIHCINCLKISSTFYYSTDNVDVYAKFLEETRKYKRELKQHTQSSFRHRELANSIRNINQAVAEMKSKRQKLDAFASDLSQVPAHVSLEVLSNGTTHMGPSVFIRTPLKTYLFNCPEGVSRFLPTLRVRPANTCDLFITRARWESIGGISGFLLSKEVNTSVQTRLHGPQKIRQYLECVRPFIDADFGSQKYPVAVEECTYDRESYEDAALTVTYMPLFAAGTAANVTPASSSLTSARMVDVAYLVELKDMPPRIDINKIIEHKVPNGPLIGKLKAGETVILPDGRTIWPADVKSDASNVDQRPTVLIVEVACADKFDCLLNSPVLAKFKKAGKQLHYVVHFTPDALLSTERYGNWMRSWGAACRHIVVNGTGEPLPQSEGPYLHQLMLNAIDGEIFPLLYPREFRGVVLQDYDEDSDKTKRIQANTLQRFSMRGTFSKDDPIVIDLNTKELEERLQTAPKGRQLINKFRERQPWSICYIDEYSDCATTLAAALKPDPYPTVVFLGTGSAVPSKYRNVSGHLLQLSTTSNILIDCGEGCYGQLRALFGADQCDRVLVNLNALMITHAHQDHMNGIYLIIIKRLEAFARLGIEYRPLVIICNRNVRKPMGIYSRNFADIESHIQIIDTSIFIKSVSPLRNDNIVVKGATGDFERRVMMDLALHLPPSLYTAESWNLREVKAVQVHHTRMAVGYVFTDMNGRKVTFSGDTMPCELLVEQGRNSDLLIHECTFEDGFEHDAFRKRHSTMGQALDIGQRMAAKHVILSHFSARYTRIPPLPDYLLEVGNVTVAMDNMVVRFDYLPVLPKLLPIYRELFSAELFDIQVKLNQRGLREVANNYERQRVGSRERRISSAFLERVAKPTATTVKSAVAAAGEPMI